MWVNEKVEEENEEILPICVRVGRRGGREGRCGSDPDPNHIPSFVLATPRSPNTYIASDILISRRDTSSNASKKSQGLGANCYAVHWKDKGKSVLLPFKEGLAPLVDDLFFHKYPVPKFEMGGEDVLFRPDWDLNVNDGSIDPWSARIC